jgi:hypothetical protein
MAKRSHQELRLVCVEWEDSCGAIARWQYLDESGPEYIVCRSVGWLVYDGRTASVSYPISVGTRRTTAASKDAEI